ncbi:MAG: LamG domain-containing protein [Chloroflexota bacterium]
MAEVAGQTCVDGNEVLIGRDHDGAKNLHWWIGCSKNNGEAVVTLKNTSGDIITLTGDTINDGNRHHLAFVRDGTTGQNNLYIDGQLSVTSSKVFTAGFASATDPVTIGWLDFSETSTFNFNGTIDEVAIYNDALSAINVAEHYVKSNLFQTNYCVPVDTSAVKFIFLPVVFR